MNFRIKVLFIAGIMGIAAISGIIQGLTAPRRHLTKAGGSQEGAGEKKLPSE